MVKKRKRENTDGRKQRVKALSLFHTHMCIYIHTHRGINSVRTHSLTLQGILHVLSEKQPHDLSADFTHIEFLGKPGRQEDVREIQKTGAILLF